MPRPALHGERLISLKASSLGPQQRANGSTAEQVAENPRNASFVSGHGFSRADKLFIFNFGEAAEGPTSRPLSAFSAACEVVPGHKSLVTDAEVFRHSAPSTTHSQKNAMLRSA
jgi:hypothetical protein